VTVARVLGALSIGIACAACGAASATSTTSTNAANAEPDRPIAHVHAARCGSCHVPVAPGTRSRDQIERAMVRHGKRLRLSDEQWRAMVEYLAPPLQAKSDDQNVR
jgi:cytochrome c5